MATVARTDVLTVEGQMVDYIEARGRRDGGFRLRLQQFLQGEGATFDLPVDPDRPIFQPPALDPALRQGRYPRTRRLTRFAARQARP